MSDKSKIDPPGIEFYDAATGKHCKLVTGDSTPFSGWIVYKHPDGQWVTWRKATADDIARIEHAPTLEIAHATGTPAYLAAVIGNPPYRRYIPDTEMLRQDWPPRNQGDEP